jgi:hypothetical protein
MFAAEAPFSLVMIFFWVLVARKRQQPRGVARGWPKIR